MMPSNSSDKGHLMKRAIFLFALTALGTSSALASTDFCLSYTEKPVYLEAIRAVAKATQYRFEELCTLPKLNDIFVASRILDDEKHQPIPHTWVTLQYSEYACQYFVREADQVITKSNCYNTW